MKMSSSFSVPEDSARVFELFLDAPTMRACIPGCEELAQVDDTHYTGRLVNEIAHVRFDASFSVEIVGIDLPHEVRAVLKGEDRRLASSMKLDAVLQVRPEGDASIVSYSMELAMWGKLGRMGESIFRRTTVEVERQFAEAFARVCAGGGELEPSPTGAGAPDPRTGVSPAVTTLAGPAKTVRASRPGYQKRAPWWRRVRAWYVGRRRRGGRR
jgi:carbon monoxide dehydrogenase subunit G